MEPDASCVVTPSLPVNLSASFRILRHGGRDSATKIRDRLVYNAGSNGAGTFSVRIVQAGAEIQVDAWGSGAAVAIEQAPSLVGARDDLEGWNPKAHKVVAKLDHVMPGLRMIRTNRVFEACMAAVVEQKVTSDEAHRSWAEMLRGWGTPAPGPERLRVPPAASLLSTKGYFEFHKFGLERRRTDVIKALASRSDRVEECLMIGEPRNRLEAFPGVGPWTSALVAQLAWGDADAVAVGDYHVAPNVVYALTGKRGGDDDAMLELIEPFRPHRGRAVRLIMASGIGPPRRTPGRPLRDFRSF